MATQTIADLKRDAKAAGLCWRDIEVAKAWVDDAYFETRRTEESVREEAWQLFLHFAGANALSGRTFWRCGWPRVGRRLSSSGRDYTAIRQHDVIASSLRERYPHLSGWSTCDIYDWLFNQYAPRRSAADCYAEAFGLVESRTVWAGDSDDWDPSVEW